ncbi:MAG: ferrochelatase [Alphaproteobacteria bacterium]|nr:ferrochelatase [Alphaproteobacteria bacterium]
MKKIAVILFNLGGPDAPEAVEPFLFNLFNDKAIIRAPQPIRYLIAKLISTRRAPIAREIYAKIGGASPILKNTQAQADILTQALNARGDTLYKCFIAMRYWHPFADGAAHAVKAFAPDEIVLLPLYPQFSTTTTQSSFDDWRRAACRQKLDIQTREVCCYSEEPGFIHAVAAFVRPAYDEAKKHGNPRILFSAHGLPEKIVKAGDPYAAQCAQTVEALRHELAIENLDSVLCFQSRVGPLKWIGPATDDEIRRAGAEKRPLVLVPVAFVSDHSETLVEIDIEYRALAGKCGVPFFASTPAVGTAPAFIEGLARLVEGACLSGPSARICPHKFSGCLRA